MTFRATAIRMEPRNDGSACLAYVTVALPEIGMEVRGVRIVVKPDGSAFAQLPQQRNHRGVWFPTVRFTNLATEEAIKAAAIEAYERTG